MISDVVAVLLLIALQVFVRLFKFLPPKVRLVLDPLVMAIASGTLIGLVVVTTREPDFDIATNQAKVIVPILCIIFFLVFYFGLQRFQEQPEQQGLRALQDLQEKQDLQSRFDLARTMIEGHHYARARTVLGAINDPKARDWETKLRRRKGDDPDFLRQFQ